MREKDLILLAKEVYPEQFSQMQKKIQEQIKQLKEPLRRCGGDGCVGCQECRASLPGVPDELVEEENE